MEEHPKTPQVGKITQKTPLFSFRCLVSDRNKAPEAPEGAFLSETNHRVFPKGHFYQKQTTGYSRKGISISSSSSGAPDNELLSAATYRKHPEPRCYASRPFMENFN